MLPEYSGHKAKKLVEFIHKAKNVFKAEKALCPIDREWIFHA
jgi:hypothetical protein